MSDRIDVTALLQRTDLVALVGSYVQLKKAGAEYVGLCPFHGEKTPSFTVVPNKGFARCFGCGFHQDAIGFLQEIEGIDFKAACERLGATTEWKPNIIERPKPPTIERITSKPPSDAGVPDMEIRQIGKPSRTWTYRDAAGDVLGYVARYDVGSNGSKRKEIRVWSWGRRGDAAEGWGCGHWPKPRPLYGLDRLAAKPGAQIMLHEGEKAADAAVALFPSQVHMGWPGGAQAWKHADFEPLRGLKVLLMPDADQPGRDCMDAIGRLLSDPRGLSCPVRICRTDDMPDGWDVADFAEGTTAEQALEWARPRISDFAAPGEPEPEPAAPDEPPPAEFPPDAQAEKPKAKRARKPRRDPDDEDSASPLSEDDLAEQFAEKHSTGWRYVKRWGQWFEWRGDGWYEDQTEQAGRLAIEICRAALYRPEARDFTAPQRRSIGRKNTAWSARDMAATHRQIAAKTDQWDTNKTLLGVPGGAVDLALGKTIEARPEDYITKRTSIAPESGKPELWLHFINTVMAGNQEMISYLQRFAGYCLTGDTREQCLVFLYGTGQNGKGVFITTLSRILGDYARTADADVFMATEQNRHPTERARLRGARLVTVDETDSAKRWNEALIKRITGGGKMEAHFMRQDAFEFEPEFKLLVAGNHKPQLRGVGKAIQRRFHMVPFTVTIPDAERDDNLPAKLEAEYPRILHWMLEGCAQWHERGLTPPQEIRDATQQYIQSEDTLGEWMEERTEQQGEVSRPIAYKDYRAWMDQRGERAWSSKAWWAALEERGLDMRRTNTDRFIIGLSLRERITDASSVPSWHDDR